MGYGVADVFGGGGTTGGKIYYKSPCQKITMGGGTANPHPIIIPCIWMLTATGYGSQSFSVSPPSTTIATTSVQYDASFPKSRLGTKEWDYNLTGVAHYGMLADFLKDARTLPGGFDLIDNNLMFSADYFFQTWKKCELQKANVK